ncbi:M20 family metallo-hydrolase [Solitalea canadensis]|uniref:Acetylornithine deacetylase/succinyldiaminopimelate desuccinylase-like deacylase n=1 Tax=Solitalea canadensis (strain ATCC 29591 / DSM 3403 / JCM 21819 / LMG 8368 / NBRC 15130 / NCIMB 12057 / USAM 9D) TaxID=929556 RepID=H8KSL0_SOLCM|nr:M20 family metallo-hydrolase [Solitalea canadensis]AFD08561.1 acetylornithine deacetylase/succinyldiaminopimelate desuccinylase-like deacylase [Solitalea canadensis DSM 3403]
MNHQLKHDAIELLKKLISIQSFSKEENITGDVIEAFLKDRGVYTFRKIHNIWAFNKHYDPKKPTVLLNSHHDTVKPNKGYTKDPFSPIVEDGKLYGLGSNDAGGCLVSLMATFLHYHDQPDLNYNVAFAASAEEEISGFNGIELIVPKLGPIEFAIVGEPTQMHLAIAEKGLMVCDCIAYGKSGHAAREEGDNAIYKALKDIQWLSTYQFPKVSPFMGPIKMSVTIIHAGSQHNVVPDRCEFTVDVRVTEQYTHEELLETIRANVGSEVTPRSMRMRSSSIPETHPIVQAGLSLGRTTYGSPTTSDQALIPVPSLKMGPGDSARSHTADEFIYLTEIEEGIDLYIDVLGKVIF